MSDRDDEQLERLIRPLATDTAPADAELLARLRRMTLDEVTLNEITRAPASADGSLEPHAGRQEGPAPINPKERNMITVAVRAAVATAALLLGGLFWFSTGNPAGAGTLGEVLDAARQATTLQLKVVRDGNAADVWLQEGGRLRWQESPTKYWIADGTSLWEIDEDANVSQQSDNRRLASAAENADLLALLGFADDQVSALRATMSSGTTEQNGSVFRLYRATTTIDERRVVLEAFVDPKTNRLHKIAAWPAGQVKRQVPPVAELRLVAQNAPVNHERFVWAGSLGQDGRIGKVADRQGIVLLRPKLHRRWTPVCRQLRLKPGDQLRTDVRGANAVSAQLVSGATVTIGPGTLAEFVSATDIRLHYGELQVVGGRKAKLEIEGPDKQTTALAQDDAALFYAARGGKLVPLPKKPVWLLGFEGTVAGESIGSLITKVDGRDVPLTIGYHKVKVEIRDQIARTTIEESFVNRTPRRLEGIFHFPLPQDASISGFGMWINGELVMADVVEKQRAREIYETILRERRDPGLLEWTGGNIFKARVFPIEPHSEKRIKIVYTQVLPLRANQFRYSYALRSEMLQKTPLRELSVDVRIHSSMPLKKVDSPTHPVRIEQTERSASVQFSAQEYSPTRDFELVCDIDGRASDVVTIPHRRGDDGYFMIQLMPPSSEGNWQREVLPDGEPLDLLLVCDTSGSMDRAKRQTQAEFVAAVLSSLGEDDRYNIAACDVDCPWLFEGSVPPDEQNIERTRTWLNDRVSLGWTDLDAAFASVQTRVRRQTHVIYIGDGVVSARDANAQDFAARIRRLYGEKTRGTFHAVSTGSSFESVVLKAIASLGRGSVRAIGSGQTPMSVALELLNEMAQPGLRDLRVEFRGVQVAAVYPGELPNLAAGTQQILIGRYQPAGRDQAGEVVVTGLRGDERVRYSARIPLKDAEKGNSFIPRLWARAHLDHLLQQGNNSLIRDEIIALSEEFHIITPYTSLLVLETDEDRERFGVKRRYQMRDGERFFADGRNAANYELQQQVRREAGNWRLGLRRQVLRELAQLGRDVEVVERLKRLADMNRTNASLSSLSASSSPASEVDVNGSLGEFFGGVMLSGGVAGRGMGGGGGVDPLGSMSGEISALLLGADGEGMGEASFPVDEAPLALEDFEELDVDSFKDKLLTGNELDDFQRHDGFRGKRQFALAGEKSRRIQPFLGWGTLQLPVSSPYRRRLAEENENAWLSIIFPHLPAPHLRARHATAVAKDRKKSDWPRDAIDLSRSLLRNDWIRKLSGGLEMRRTVATFDPLWERQTIQVESLDLFSRDAWLTWSFSDASGKTIQWNDPQQRGAISATFNLGRVRKSSDGDRRKSIDAGYYTFGDGLHVALRHFNAQVSRGDGEVQLLLTRKDSSKQQQRITIDTTKRAVAKVETMSRGKVTATTTFSDFVEIEGAWWPCRREVADAEGRVTSRSTTVFRRLSRAEFAARHGEELATRGQVVFLHHPLPTIEAAETAATDGSADVEDRLTLISRSSRNQKWDEVLKQLGELEELIDDKPGKHWIRLEVLKSARRNAEALQLIHAEAAKLSEAAKSPEAASAELSRANHLINSAWSISSPNEVLKLLRQLEPLYVGRTAGPVEAGTAKNVHRAAARQLPTWNQHHLQALRRLSRIEEMLDIERQHIDSHPWDVNAQLQYARDLANFGSQQAAYARLKTLVAIVKWHEDQRTQIWRTWADMLRQQGDSAAQVEVVRQWLGEESAAEEPYARYLSALMFDDRMDELRDTARRWLADGRVEGERSGSAVAKVNAAINHALGRGWNYHANTVIPDWQESLQQTALYFLRHEHHFSFTRRIMNASQFADTDAADRVRERMFDELSASAASLRPEWLADYIRWIQRGKPARDAAAWRPIADVLRKRWDGLKHQDDSGGDKKHAVGEALVRILQVSFPQTDYLPFLRDRVAQASKRWRDQYVSDLLDVLLHQPWTAEIEVELFGLSGDIARHASDTRITSQVAAVQRLVDRMLVARVQADQNRLQDAEHPEDLTRQELAEKEAGFLKSAREGLAARLAIEAKKHDGLLGQWLQMERMYLDVRLKRSFDQVADECVEILGPKPPVLEAAIRNDDAVKDAADPSAIADSIVAAAIRQRALMTYANIAVRKSAKPALRNWLLDYVDAGIARGEASAASWKLVKYDLLIALDEPQQLEKSVRKWIRTDKHVTNWRRLLARLCAERGEIDEAIALFETVERDSQLAPSDYNALANWYLIRDEKEKFRRARVEALKMVREYQLQSYVNQQWHRWRNTDQPLPTELDEIVLFTFQALFEKSANPGNYLYTLREFYRACRDFRLLRMIPDSVVGRTPQQVYNFLEQLRATALAEVRKEATADEILARIETLRQRELTAIDLRALDLLEALVERQSAEVLNQPGPHVEAAVASLQRAFDRDWGDGEGRQMAKLLDSLGQLKHERLAAEQLRQLDVLHMREEPGTDDRLFTGSYLANATFHAYGRRDDGLRRMEMVIREYEQSHPTGWPSQANTPLSQYVQMLEVLDRHAEAERLLKKHLKKPLNSGQRNWLTERLTAVYSSALKAGSRVSLGANEELYRNLIPLIVAHARRGSDYHQRNVLGHLQSVFRTAQQKRFPTLRKDLRKFGFDTLPAFLKTQQNNYHSMVSLWAELLGELLGSRDGLEFLVERIENYPRRLLHTWENPWQQFGYRLGNWRLSAGDLGDLEPRLLAIVLAELRRDLETGNSHNRYLYRKNRYFWTAKEQDFVRLAEEVLARHGRSERTVRHIADYFWDGLRHRDRAIEVLFIAMNNKHLDDNGQAQLVDWLQHAEMKRYAESIAILEGLVERNPVNMHFRCELITAYHKTARAEQRGALMKETIELFRQKGRWNESNVQQLARCAHDNSLHGRTIHLLGELIPMHKRQHPTRGIGQGTLPMYYMWLANAHSLLQHTEAAVDAAAAAIVSWGSRHDQRLSAVNSLDSVTRDAKDLDAYVGLLDRRAAETGQDSAIIRRSIGKAYATKGEPRKAIAQLRIAVELQPGDLDAQKLLIESYDAVADHAGAVSQLLALIDLDRHNLSRYEELAKRLQDDTGQAERAATAIVEAAPNEAEHHESLARLRERQEAYASAVLHWQRVAQLRSLEPNGLIHLARAQQKAGQREAAEATISRIRETDWPSRFDSAVQTFLREIGGES